MRAFGIRWLWPTLAVVSAVTLLLQLGGPHATAWHFFHDAADLLTGSGPEGQAGGLHLYRDRPDLQFGPLSIVVAVPLTFAGETGGAWLAMILSSVAGLLAVKLLFDAVDRLLPGLWASVPPPVLYIGGATAIITWGDVAVRTAHIDDAIALLALTAALRWCAGGAPWPATFALAVAAAAKPWAIMFAPLALLPLAPVARRAGDARSGAGGTAPPALAGLPGWLQANRQGVLRFGLAGVLAVATWAPFVLAEPSTLSGTADFTITNDPTSVLQALGVSDPVTPSWARPAQLAGGLAVVLLLVVARRWPAALLAGVAWRLLLDPGANRYYTIGLVLGALLVELLARRDRIPWRTVLAAVVLEATAMPGFPALPGRLLRLVCVLLALWAACRASLPAPAPESMTDARRSHTSAGSTRRPLTRSGWTST